MHRRTVLSVPLAAIAGCGASRSLPTPRSRVEIVAADRSVGFNFPYLLRYPDSLPGGNPSVLLVEPNNSGRVSVDFNEHLRAAERLIDNGLGGQVAKLLRQPLLMPVFPRGPDLYTHSLGRTTIQTTDPQLRRLDHQLLAMVASARRRLSANGWQTSEKVILTGFSASAMFVTRFAALHPSSVQAVAAGGLNGFVILPVSSLAGATLSFPLGVADIADYTGQVFQATTWNRIPQYLFMGAEDANDAVLFDDSYSSDERELVFGLVGREMLPKRWERCRQIYRDAGASAIFVTYVGLGHGTNETAHNDVAKFLSSMLARDDI